ncbi:MAG: aminotransferase class I/II-fold pyridoxal phosphate-dependent enzyme [Anaerostipes sp.]|jgi:dTDP-4-amino-4,6-dideoxygalactose transaminase|nr:aminotransferase class I/II-fold pyridoxal phosphate-dependent enzyme [Anaerostipes sp.]
MSKRIYMASPTMYGDEQKFIQEAFDTNWIAPLGPNVNGFEQEMEAYTGIPYCTALSAGTAAIHLALKLLHIQQGDTVICSSFTFSATANPIAYEKGKIVYVDSEPETWNMSPEALKRALQAHPEAKAVIVVHLYGTPAKIEEIQQICEDYKVPLIEDAAESLGAFYKGQQTGNFGELAAFSFNGNKIITTSGGGMLASKKEAYTKKALFLATQAREPKRHYEHKEIGYNYRMSNIVAGIGRGQLMHIEEHIQKKKAIYETYKKAFSDIKGINMNPYEQEKAKPNFWLSCITIEPEIKATVNDIMDALEKENIESRPVWKPLHMQPVFKDCEFFSHRNEGEVPVCEEIFSKGICLPSDIKNTPEDMKQIIDIIQKMVK